MTKTVAPRVISRKSVPPAPAHRAGFAPALLTWYDRHRRVLPWRSAPGNPSDPYAVWLSEIMLQQTTVAAVKPYFAAFLAAWPSVEALAAAPLDNVLKAWAGLGYYSRARNLHACARAVMADHDGRFPTNETGLRSLPGVGAYTAAAIAAIAFGRRAVVVDGNVERVMARVFAIETSLPQAKAALYAAMDSVTPVDRSGDFAQAVMDLGATLCTPRKPACVLCPLTSLCDGRRLGLQHDLPRKPKKLPVPQRSGAVFFIRKPNGSVLVRQRPTEGLFGGMTEFPSTEWKVAFSDDSSPKLLPELVGLEDTLSPLGKIEHGLTHFQLTLHLYGIEVGDGWDMEGVRWVAPSNLEQEALPTLMRKVMAKAFRSLEPRNGNAVFAGRDKTSIFPFQTNLTLDSLEPELMRRRPQTPEPDEFRMRRMPRRGRRRKTP